MTTATMTRLQNIDNYILRKNTEAEEKKRRMEEEDKAARAKVLKLNERVEGLLTVANKLREAGIALPERNTLRQFGYDYDAVAEGFYHAVGFQHNTRIPKFDSRGKLAELVTIGFYNGGACGPWDFFYRPGAKPDVWLSNEHNRDYKLNPSSTEYNKFLRQFPVFEEAFYKWLDVTLAH